MTRFPDSLRAMGLPALGLASMMLTGCPGETNDGDTGPLADVPGTDVPTDTNGADVPPTTDTGVDGGGPVTCGSGIPALDVDVFASGFNQPVYMAAAPGTDDLFVMEVGGRIRVLSATGEDGGTFLDISDEVRNSGSPGDEQGLLGLVFHPEYEANGLFYVYYTEDGSNDNVVAVGTRETARTADPAVQVILRMDDFASNHNGGCMQFGPDGELYIGTGDGGGGGDPMETGQDTEELLGKILRIHVDATTGTSYTSPASNPFAGATPGRDEIFAYGMRNPWRFSFDRATGDLLIGDVGQNAWEEIDFVPAGTGAGDNFGWSECEGFAPFGAAGSECALDHHEPIVAVSHGSDPVTPSGVSITGGYVYRGTEVDGLQGVYLFADAYGGWVAGLRYCDETLSDYQEIDDLSGGCPGGPVSFAQDNAGELYMVCYGGSIRRIVSGG